ncbi:MAG: methyltransferase domain-containing protein [Saprospiraceae bacterium]|nr:methyltransferase domain-containing protein [Saprospiraceae bacterium]
MTDYRDHKSSWDDRYRSRRCKSLQPEQFLIDHVTLLKPGSVLDIACGEGRNSIFLAQKGFKVSALDFSEVALNRLSNMSTENNLDIETIELDLSESKNFARLWKYDNIITIHFKLRDDLLELIPSLLNRNGIFLYCTFNKQHAEASTFPEKYALKKGELIDKKWELERIKYTSFIDDAGYYDGYLFRR